MHVMANPHAMFDVKDQVALITGASGAFGMVAARILAGAGCKLVLVAGNQSALNEIADETTGRRKQNFQTYVGGHASVRTRNV